MADSVSGGDDALVLVDRMGAIARLTLNRPEQFNALTGDMIGRLDGVLRSLGADPSVRVIVLAAAGRAFCAGHDLRDVQQTAAAGGQVAAAALFARCSRMMQTIQTIPQPVIARVHGVATAAGCQLVAMCDLAVASSDARFAVSGINLGLFCATPGVALSRNISRKQAFEMLVTGEFIDASTALERGLINRVVAMDSLDDEIASLAAMICAKPAHAIGIGKQLFYRQLEMGIAGAYQLAGQTMACNLVAEPTQEGIEAFLEKRPPRWIAP
jgi:enoyl-CoA hydratase/carnithine racemase